MNDNEQKVKNGQKSKETKIPKRKYESYCSKCKISLNSDEHEWCYTCSKLKCPICGGCDPTCPNSTNQYVGSYYF